MNQLLKNRVSSAIRGSLEDHGIELTWHDTDHAADAVMEEFEAFLLGREVNIH